MGGQRAGRGAGAIAPEHCFAAIVTRPRNTRRGQYRDHPARSRPDGLPDRAIGDRRCRRGRPGVLAEVRVDRGDRVEPGQVLAVLDRDVEKAMVETARARAKARAETAAARATRDMARQKLTRIAALNKLNYGAQLELEMAQGELKVAEHRLQQSVENHEIAEGEHQVTRRQLDQRVVRSPIGGVVADRLLDPGERADGQPILRVVTLDSLHVELVIPAERFGEIRKGMTLNVQPEIGERASLAAEVVQVDAFIDAASATYRARLALANGDLTVPAGVRCQVMLEPAVAPTDGKPRA
ncbi:MAG: efflux RND transporter periplasmic adaptor subunit [Burkholderiaceae bacterium]